MKIFAAHRINKLRINNCSFPFAMLALIVLVGTSACSKIDELDPNSGWIELNGDCPIEFSSNLSEHETKASLDAGTTFGVFAYYTGSGNWSSSSSTPNFMYNEDVLYDGTSYTYNPIKYWPNKTGEKLSFWAYSPFNTTNLDVIAFRKSGNTGIEYTTATTGFPDIYYTIIQGKTDLLVANTITNRQKQPLNQRVSFTFHHTLSKINFKVQKASADPAGYNYTITLNAIGFKWIHKTGLHRSTSNPHNTTPWTDLSGADNTVFYAYNPGTGIDVTQTSAIDVSDATVMLIPQNLENGAILHIEYSVSLNGGPAQDYVEEVSLDMTEGSDNDLWEEKKQYTYTLSITPGQPISFTVSCDTWGDVYHWHLTT